MTSVGYNYDTFQRLQIKSTEKDMAICVRVGVSWSDDGLTEGEMERD
jgi:hypothetical protein